MSINPDKAQSIETWAEGALYDPYVGRWSRLVAQEFITWLDLQRGIRWLDVGSGTGAVTATILDMTMPNEVKGVDSSEAFVEYARDHFKDERVLFKVGDALALPFETARYDAAVSGLVLNFMVEPERMIADMVRVVRAGGTVGLYVWDYAGGMQMMRYFWRAATELDPSAAKLDEGSLFPMCRPQTLERLFRAAALENVQVRPLIVPTEFRDFDDYWTPFLSGQAPAPAYCVALPAERRAALRERLRTMLPYALDGTIPLFARAWAVKGEKGSG
jgi:SAM-dependent methyltransferase